MSDDAYSSFLDHANQDTGASKSSTQSTLKGVSTKAIDADIPAVIQSIKVDYTSETDEPFEPVSLSYGGKHLPSENEFGELVSHKGDVSTVDPKEFDPHEQYKEVLQTAKNAGNGELKVFRLQHGKTRVEYYVVGLDEAHGKIVGLKVLAVES